MKYTFTLLLLSLLFVSCNNDKATEAQNEDTENTTAEATTTDYTIKPGEGIGALLGEMDKNGLIEQLGSDQVKNGDFYIGEGEYAPGLILYPDTPEEVEVLLDEDGFVILYRMAKTGSQWATKEGIKVGSTLQELEAANGKPFKFTGFDWDYGGTVTNWNGGTFDGKDFLVVLEYDYEGQPISQEDSSELLGDQDVMSNAEAAQRYDIKVVKIMQRY